jgi:hypothetical protein
MSVQAERAARFWELHHRVAPLLLPNPWDAGSAKLFASLGFQALATTSGGYAATIGRLDGSISRDGALAHAAVIVAATDLPVSADLENGFADAPAGSRTRPRAPWQPAWRDSRSRTTPAATRTRSTSWDTPGSGWRRRPMSPTVARHRWC